jgi:hypothetical protein
VVVAAGSSDDAVSSAVGASVAVGCSSVTSPDCSASSSSPPHEAAIIAAKTGITSNRRR